MSQTVSIIIGRFQLFHNGHKRVVNAALKQAAKVLVLVGSASTARSMQNPFTYDKRKTMIAEVYPTESAEGRLIIQPIDDTLYDDAAWIRDVEAIVNRTAKGLATSGQDGSAGDVSLSLSAFGADRMPWYRRKFPNWTYVEAADGSGTPSEADIREAYFQATPILPEHACPQPIVTALDAFRSSEAFQILLAETEYVRAYRKTWSAAPFVPTFTTVDTLVLQSGHIPLVRRGGQPGKGLLALPGGFLDPQERLRDAAIRKLREETAIRDPHGEMSSEQIDKFVEDGQTSVFDAPFRSSRGRTITHCFLIRLPDTDELYHVIGSDDAEHAHWYRIEDLEPATFFEDHYSMIRKMLGV